MFSNGPFILNFSKMGAIITANIHMEIATNAAEVLFNSPPNLRLPAIVEASAKLRLERRK